MTRASYVPDDAESILDHGAVEGEDTFSAGKTNAGAIMDAAATSDGSNVYVPSGEFYLAQDADKLWVHLIDSQTYEGLSVYGDSAQDAYLTLSSEQPTDGTNKILFWYRDSGGSHGNIVFEGVTLDGNLPELDWASDTDDGGLQEAMVIDDDADVDEVVFNQFRCRHIHNEGFSMNPSDMDVTVTESTFVDFGIGRTNDKDGTSINHMFTDSPDTGHTFRFEDCEFRLVSGNVIDPSTTNIGGELIFRNCWCSGIGDALIKEKGMDSIVIENLYFEANTPELEERMTNASKDEDRHGRSFLRQISGATDSWTNLTLNHIEARDMLYMGLQLSSGHNWNVTGGNDGPVMFHDSNLDTSLFDTFVRCSSDSTMDWNLSQISVHGATNTDLFDDRGDFSGTIDTLHWDDADSLGDPGSLSIDSDVYGGDPFEPVVPSQSEVGIDSSGGSDDEEKEEEEEVEEVEEENLEPVFDDWTPRWGSDHDDWSVASETSYDGDHALVFQNDGNNRTRYALSWDNIGEPSDVEVLDKFRVPRFNESGDLGFHARVHLRSATTNGAEEGYWIEVEKRREAFRLAKYTESGMTTMARFGTPQEDVFFYRRFRAEGTELKAKIWPATETEPTEWDVEVTDSAHADGWVGLGSFDAEIVETDTFSVGTGGESAPLPTSDSTPAVSLASPDDGQTVSEDVTLHIDASDPEDDDDSLVVDFRIDDNQWKSASYNSETGYYEGSFDSTALTDGEYTLETRVTNSAGNTASDRIGVIVENEEAYDLGLETVGTQSVDETSATLVGELTTLDSADEATVGFEWRATGTDNWNSTSLQTRTSTGEFTTDIVELESGTEYEFRAIATEPTEVTAGSLTVQTSNTDVYPVIEQFDIEDKSNRIWSRFDVDWTVSHADSDLDTVVTKLRLGGVIVAAESTSVTGETASYSHVMRVRGDVDEVVLSANDTKNHVTKESKDV